MIEVAVFGEDFAHLTVLTAFVIRYADMLKLEVQIRDRNVTGGHGKVETEVKMFFRDLQKGYLSGADLIIIGRDANCTTFAARMKEMHLLVPDCLRAFTCFAIPEPHIERWLLLDSSAFKAVLGKGCEAPDRKCDRDRYKDRLRQSVREAGLAPIRGGLEHADDIVNAMDLGKMETSKEADRSLKAFLQDLRQHFARLAKKRA